MSKIRQFGCLALVALLSLAMPARAAEEDDIKKAIDAGIKYLRSQQDELGRWRHEDGLLSGGSTGATALAGLTLIECDVPLDDPAIQKAANVVRRDSIELTYSYALSLSIMFLDLMGDEQDEPLIESMTVRLMAGQTRTGGWTYSCPKLAQEEKARLGTILKARKEPEGKREPRRGEFDPKREPRKLSAEIAAQIDVIKQVGLTASMSDNSNTQFALLALWVARRHDLPVDKSLALVDARFRASQCADGGWSYSPTNTVIGITGAGYSLTRPTMTCAGLLGLAVGHGSRIHSSLRTEAKKKKNDKNDKGDPKDKGDKGDPKDKGDKGEVAEKAKRDPGKDQAVLAGLKALGTVLKLPKKGDVIPNPAYPFFSDPSVNYYLMWSIERVAVAYDLQTIGNKDWYPWGCDLILPLQQKDGAWRGTYAEGGIDTCFALLFLRKANLALDLSTSLKGKVQDPDRVVLKARSGGVGDEPPKDSAQPPVKPGKKKPGKGNEKSGERPVKPREEEPQPPKVDRPVAEETEASRLSKELVKAPADGKATILDKLRQGKGGEYTVALAGAIPSLEGESKKKARDALADRLTSMTTATLREKLADSDPEVRRAAALACAMKEDKSNFGSLIGLLDDKETSVARAAYASLKSLSGKDFGPSKNADRIEIAKSVASWKAWWKDHGGK